MRTAAALMSAAALVISATNVSAQAKPSFAGTWTVVVDPKPGDVVAVKGHKRSLDQVRINLGDNPPPLPDYLEVVSTEPPTAKLTRMPGRGDVDPHIQEIREQLIIEVVSR